jgi:DOPA 4,5-dioxygenase
MTFVPIDQIRSYHAHIYFKDSDERETAAVLRERIGERFLVQLGRWHEQPIGPHERPMYQVAFATALFASFVPWLMLNRCGLVILIHPNTGHARADHLVHALWLGNILAIERPEQLPDGPTNPAEDIVSPNTSPTLKPDC